MKDVRKVGKGRYITKEKITKKSRKRKIKNEYEDYEKSGRTE